MLVPPGQAGAEVFNCPDSYFIINGIRLCGEKLNDASTELDFTKNAPVTGELTLKEISCIRLHLSELLEANRNH